jgi:glycosyltransferase involved in cell wall biosynthesis
MVYTAGTRMTMAIGRSDAAEANRVFQSAQLFIMRPDLAGGACALGAAVCGHRPKNDGRRGIRICRSRLHYRAIPFRQSLLLEPRRRAGKDKAFALWRRPVEVRPHCVPTKGKFDILFAGVMSLRKGIHYLAEAFQRIDHPAKTLSFVGWHSAEMITLLRQQNLWPENARCWDMFRKANLRM